MSDEFRIYREQLWQLLIRPDVDVKVQEDFILTGMKPWRRWIAPPRAETWIGWRCYMASGYSGA